MHVTPFHFLISLLNIAVEFGFFMASGSVFQRRAPLNTNELTPYVFVFRFGICNKLVVLNSYFMCFLSKNVHMNDGPFERHLKI